MVSVDQQTVDDDCPYPYEAPSVAPSLGFTSIRPRHQKLATATKNLPPDHPKVVRLNNECALSLCNDKSEYESRLSNSLNTRLLFKYYQQIAHSIYYALY